MCDPQYDVSDYMKKLFLEKQKQREAAKVYYRNLLYNPHLPPNQGPPYDPAVLRYGAMSAYHHEIFRPNFKKYAIFFLTLSPLLVTYWAVRYTKSKEEELIRSGQVAYSDRMFKRIQ